MGRINDIGLDHKIITDKVSRKAIIGMNATYLSRCKKHVFWLVISKEGADSGLIGQVQFSVSAGKDFGAALLCQGAAKRRTDQTSVSCNVDGSVTQGR